MTNKRFSMAEQRKGIAEKCMRRICTLLEWSEEKYCWYKYLCGLKYLQVYLKHDQPYIEQLERSKVFWNWWKNHWTLREEQYLQDVVELTNVSITTRRTIYRGLNNPEELAAEIYPNAVALGDSYAEMIAHTYTTTV